MVGELEVSDLASDGGIVVAGATDLSLGPGVPTALVLKLDSAGGLLWEKTYGEGFAFSIRQTSDGGFVVAGVTGFSTSSGMAMVLRLDSSGGIVWQRAVSGPSAASWVQQTSDGGFVVAATSGSAPSTFGAVALVFKLNSMGEIHPCKDLSNTSLATATLSAPATSITGGSPVDITSTSPDTTTTFTSSDISATSTVLCR